MGTIKIVDSIQELAQAAFSSGNDAVRYVFGQVPATFAAQVKDVLDTPIDGYSYIVDISAMRHVLSAHGNVKMEAAQGQIAVTVDDFAAFPQILGQPDSVEYQGKNGQGNPAFLLQKKTAVSLVFCVIEVRPGRKEVAMKTLYKRKTPTLQ